MKALAAPKLFLEIGPAILVPRPGWVCDRPCEDVKNFESDGREPVTSEDQKLAAGVWSAATPEIKKKSYTNVINFAAEGWFLRHTD